MNTKTCLLCSAFLAMIVVSLVSTSTAAVITFDDMSSFSNGVPLDTVITNGYQGLNWSNLHTVNAIHDAQVHGVTGYYDGMVTTSNVAFNGFGNPAEVDSSGTNFNFLSVYLTGAWNSNLNIEVQGFSGTTLLYDSTVVASATSPTLFTFDYENIDRLLFTPSGGQNAGFPLGSGVNFVMDNMTIEFVPEPSSLLLTGFASLALLTFFRRKRA